MRSFFGYSLGIGLIATSMVMFYHQVVQPTIDAQAQPGSVLYNFRSQDKP